MPEKGELELINKYTVKPLSESDVYTFSLILCDNEVDRDFERFDIPALEKLAELFPGKTGIFDHSMRGHDQTARIYRCEIVRDPIKKTSAGEPYTALKAAAYMPCIQKNADLIEEIDAGIKKETSVGCAVKRSTCSICGKDSRLEGCAHIKGHEYDGKLCHTVLSEPTDAYEWSFVAVPAQPAAGVTKSFEQDFETRPLIKRLSAAEESVTLSAAEAKGLSRFIASLSEEASEGKAYRDELICEIIRMGAILVPAVPGECLTDICKSLSVTQLGELKKAFIRERSSLRPQLAAEQRESTAHNEEFKI